MSSKTNYDSDFCGSLPLSFINVIQDYGYLFVIDQASYTILQVSENAGELVQKSAAELANSALDNLFDTSEIKKRQQEVASGLREKMPVALTMGDKSFQTLVHFKGQYIILEIEKAEFVSKRAFTEVYEEVKVAIGSLEVCNSVAEVSKTAVTEIKKITGFDGVMMYQFDSGWNGTVIAQDKTAPELEDYMGHTFPASDIPKQARDLYLKNPYRLIPNRSFQPVRLYPVLNPVTHAFIDLSDCNIRGVAPVHLEYLQNMRVESSMSIRVIHNGKLWGLIACHHTSAHYINFELCSICELLSSVISNRISAILQKDIFEKEAELGKLQGELMRKVYAEGDLTVLIGSEVNNSLLTMFNSDSSVTIINGKYESVGKVPNKDMIENLLLWLQSKMPNKIFYSDQLSEIFEEALSFAEIASGLMAIPLNSDKGDYLLCFRPELIQTINWGGNPNNAIRFDLDGKKYHPRASFKLWQETVNHTSAPWSEQEIAVAENLRTFIFDYTTKHKG